MSLQRVEFRMLFRGMEYYFILAHSRICAMNAQD